LSHYSLLDAKAEMLFEEDFEGDKLDETKWYPKSEWNTGEFIKTPY